MDTTRQLENSSKMNKQTNSEAQTADVQLTCRQQNTAVQEEELQNTTDIYNMSEGPEGEMIPQQFVLQENTPMSTHTPQDTGEKESQASREDLLKQNEELREQLKRQKEEKQAFQKDMLKIIWGLKTRPQTQFEEWKENILKQHEEEISLQKDEKASAFSALKEEARKAMEEEIDELNAFISQLKGTEHRTERQTQNLLDTITQKTHQVEALKQNLKEEQMKKEVLRNQVLHLQSSLDQQEWVYTAAQNTPKSALDQEKCSTREVHSQLELQEGESQELEKKVSFLRSALSEQRSIIIEAESKLQTLQDEKVGLESVVKELRCRVTEQEEMIQEQQARTQTLNLDLQTERVTSKDVIKCYAAHISALTQINELTKQVKDSSQENESLKNSLKDQPRTAEQKIEELSEALSTSEETNSALRQENKELQETLATNEEQWQERVRLKKRKRW